MSKLPYLACLGTLLLLGAKPQNDAKAQNGVFSKYKAVEAYEIRPGVLAMPSYTEDGRVCEIGVSKSSYSPNAFRIAESFSQKEIDQIVDELAPPDERGPKSRNPFDSQSTFSGQAYVERTAYENVTIDAYGRITSISDRGDAMTTTGDVAFTITWTKRKCQ